MNFDWTLSVGNVVEFCALVLSLFVFLRKMHKENSERLYRIEKTIGSMNIKMAFMWAWFAKEHGLPAQLGTDED